jgi:hypothetical protein
MPAYSSPFVLVLVGGAFPTVFYLSVSKGELNDELECLLCVVLSHAHIHLLQYHLVFVLHWVIIQHRTNDLLELRE